ncbi:uncharacterized protein [Montipora foliosa]|uniref:uncharacterized protein n=1 Tax=Montipora foliosa TaxID=591990 RepID=UPI0035F13FF8
MPMRTRNVHSTEPPWITSSLKNLLQKRQSGLSRGDDQMFREWRNRVNRKRKMCRANYYQAKVEHLNKCKPPECWKEVKKLNGRSLASSAKSDTLQSLQHLYESIDQIGLANIINEAFLSPMYCFTPLPAAFPCTTFNNYSENPLVVSVESVRTKLSKLNPCKANGPDNIPGWLLKENADILACPVSDILNYSSREGHLPSSWKHAELVPVPKQKPLRDVNKHFRPISLTPILSKIMWLTLTLNLLCWSGLTPNNLGPYLNLLLRMRLLVCCTLGWNRLTEMALLREPYYLTFAKPLT